jgi:predicted aspartyl protease
MKSSIVSSLLAASSLLSVASADAPGTLSIKIHKNRHVEKAQLAKRGTLQVTLANYEQVGLYAANATVGTPGQPLTFQVDTGSSDVWVPSSSAEICKDTREGGCPFGSCKYHLPMSARVAIHC